jgi:hypothetical protein
MIELSEGLRRPRESSADPKHFRLTKMSAERPGIQREKFDLNDEKPPPGDFVDFPTRLDAGKLLLTSFNRPHCDAVFVSISCDGN